MTFSVVCNYCLSIINITATALRKSHLYPIKYYKAWLNHKNVYFIDIYKF